MYYPCTLYLLAYKFTEHLKTLVYMLPEQKSPLDINILDQPANPKAQQLLDLLPDKFTTAKATTERHLAFLKEEKCIIRVEKGHYCKVK